MQRKMSMSNTNKLFTAIIIIALLSTAFVIVSNVEAIHDTSQICSCPEGTISYWKMDDTVTPPIVDVHGGRNGTHALGSTTPAEGIVNGSLYFDGLTEVDADNTDNAFDWNYTDSFTIELWMNSNASFSGNVVMVGRQNSSDWDWWVGGEETGNVSAFGMHAPAINSTYVQVNGNTSINDGNWHHIVAVRNGSESKNILYVDGVEEGNAIWNYTANFSSINPLNIGYIFGGYRYTGFLDEIAVYNRALTVTEISQHYNDGLEGKGYEVFYNLTVAILGNGITTPTVGTHSYAKGSNVSISATADPGWEFSGWSGDVSSTDNPVELTVDGDLSVVATFTQLEYDLSVSVVGSGSVSLNNTGPYYFGDVVELTAVAEDGWEFSGWSGDVSGADNTTVVTIDGDLSVVATFTELPEPTPSPTPEPTPSPTPEPTPSPTPEPTPSATPSPTPEPTPSPSPEPSGLPVEALIAIVVVVIVIVAVVLWMLVRRKS